MELRARYRILAHMNPTSKGLSILSFSAYIPPCPLPGDVERAIGFTKRLGRLGIEKFWPDQMHRLRKMSAHPYCSSANWYSDRPLFLPNAPSDMNVALLMQLAKFYGIGSHNWTSQYIIGFPITGAICRSETFPLTDSPDNPFPAPWSSLVAESQSRFRTRSARRPPHADALWPEAVEQVSKGWLAPLSGFEQRREVRRRSKPSAH